MDLTSIFGPAWIGAGARGFSGEGYWPHRISPNLSFAGSAFVAKTTPVDLTPGNMELTASYAPRDFFPDCIAVDFLRGNILNAVGLSAPSLKDFLSTGRWQRITQPFMASYMPLRKGDAAQEDESREFAGRVKAELPRSRTKQLGIQLNTSCPNVGADLEHVVQSASAHLSILEGIGVPVIPKLNLLVPPEEAAKIAKHPACAGLCISNTIPFGELKVHIDWSAPYPHGSPLQKRNSKYPSGGLSGNGLVHLVANWVRRFRKIDPDTYLNAGLGIMKANHVDMLRAAGANSISFASVAILRPWRVPSIIQRAHQIF